MRFKILETVGAKFLADFRRGMRRVSLIFRADQLNTYTLYPCDTAPYISHSTHSSAYSADSARKVALIKNLRDSAFASTLRKSARKVLYVATLFLLALPSRAQTPKDDLVKMNTLYRDAKSFSMDLSMSLYVKEKDLTPQVTYKGKSMRDQTTYKTEMMNRISLVNERCALMIDAQQRLILYKERDQKKDKEMVPTGMDNLNLDSLIGRQSASMSYLVNSATEKRILISNPENVYKRIEISLDPATYTIRQIVYVFADAQSKVSQTSRIVIDYRNVTMNKPLDKSLFSEATYVRHKGGKPVPAEAYKNYQLIDEGKVYTD